MWLSWKTLSIKIRETQGVTVLDLKGKITLGEACDSLRELLKQLLAANKNKTLLNLAQITFIDAMGLGTLTRALVWARKKGGELKLAAPSKQVHRALEVTGLITAFEVYASEEEALASFK